MYVVIPAGGSGTRLWPLSRATHPKFLHCLGGGERTLIQATVDRLAALAAPAETYIVTGGAHVAAIAQQLPDLPAENFLVEPSPRDSAAAIGLAAAVIARHDPTAIMGSFHADHLVRNDDLFLQTVHAAEQAARQGYLMTIGITPTHPETGYGYIQVGEALGTGEAHLVQQFKEKPARDVAEQWLAAGGYLWNSGMFVWQCAALLQELQRQQPALHAGLVEIAANWHTESGAETLAQIWPTLPKLPIDTAVMEGAAAIGRVGTVPGRFGWNDIGDWHTIGAVLAPEPGSNLVLNADIKQHLAIDTTDTVVVPGGKRLIATIGLQNLIVVDTDDAVLICPRERAQDVKKLVEQLKAQHRTDLL